MGAILLTDCVIPISSCPVIIDAKPVNTDQCPAAIIECVIVVCDSLIPKIYCFQAASFLLPGKNIPGLAVYSGRLTLVFYHVKLLVLLPV